MIIDLYMLEENFQYEVCLAEKLKGNFHNGYL